MKKIVLITGGARSGKSQYAIDMAKKINKKTVFLATLEFKDEEMKKRIDQHRKSRPSEWQTVEEGKNVDQVLLNLKGLCDVIVIDCLTNLISNLLLELQEETEVLNRIKSVMKIISEIDFTVIMVSNEVGSGIVPASSLGRKFRDIAGSVNQLAAKYADEVYLMTAGIPLCVKGEKHESDQRSDC